MKSITRCLAALVCVITALVVMSGSASGAIYPSKKWTFRIKPELVQESIFFMDNYVVLESSSHTLNFVNMDTGEKFWQFGFYASSTVYLTGDGGLIALSDNIMHKLDVANRRIVWSQRLKKDRFEKLLISQDGSHIAVKYGENSFETIALKEKKKTYGSTNLQQGFRELVAEKKQSWPPSAAGDGTTLSIDGEKAELRDKANGAAARWTFIADAPLARTAALFAGQKLLLVSSTGKMYFVNAQTGVSEGELDIKEFIQMRFWDEKPENIDNYAGAMVLTKGDNIFLAGPSSFSRFGLLAFPASVSLEPEKKPDTTYGWALEKAIGLWDDKNYTEAVKGMQEVVGVWPDAPEAHLFLGMAYSTVGKTDEAIAELDRAYALDPLNPDIVSNLSGNCIVKIMSLDPDTQSAKIVELYEKVKKIQPDNKMAYIGLAELYVGKKDYKAARDVAAESFNNGFFSADMSLLLLSAYYMEGSSAEALALADETIKLFPKLPTTYLIKGKLQCKNGDYKAAIKTFNDAPATGDLSSYISSLLPRYLSSGYRFFYGNALGLTGNYESAVKRLSDFLAWIPTSYDMKELKKAYAAAMSDKDAKISASDKRLFDKYAGKNNMELDAEVEFRDPALLAEAHFYILWGKSDKALELLKKVNTGGGHDPEISSYIGYLYCKAGSDLARAKEYTATALKGDPKDPVFLRNNAVCLAAKGDNKAAEDVFLKAINLNTDTELLRYEYGSFLLKTGRKKEAAEQFRKEIEISPDIQASKDALAALGKKYQ